MPEIHERECSRCLFWKDRSNFTRLASSPDGLDRWCRACWSAYNVARYATAEGKEARRRSKLKFHYAITPEDFSFMLHAQHGRCKICGTDTAGGRYDRFNVDHIGGTKTVRGLLCSDCNVALGLLGDNPWLLMAAFAYLIAHGYQKKKEVIIYG